MARKVAFIDRDQPSAADNAFDINGVASLIENLSTESGRRFVDLVSEAPALLLFLRHAGCTFCREALADVANARKQIEAGGTRIVLVHMGDRRAIGSLLTKYGLEDLERVCDPSQTLYRTFGLKRGRMLQLFGLKVWWRGFVAGVVKGHGIGKASADARQMPGVFLVDQGMIAKHFRHNSAADRPEYTAICRP